VVLNISFQIHGEICFDLTTKIDSALCRLALSFFCTARSRNKILSNFKEAVKVTVYQKSVIGDLACPKEVKYNFKFGIIQKKKSTLRYAALHGVDFCHRIESKYSTNSNLFSKLL
jgi:spore germination protein YaaH